MNIVLTLANEYNNYIHTILTDFLVNPYLLPFELDPGKYAVSHFDCLEVLLSSVNFSKLRWVLLSGEMSVTSI